MAMQPDSENAEANAGEERASRGIQSVEVGGRLLLALVHFGRRMPLKDLAREADMSPAKAHPYLVSFGKLGLVEQDPASGQYGLGPLALQMGMIGLQQADPVRLASAALPELALATGHTAGVAIWGNRGPTFVRLEEGPTAVHVNMRHGTVVSVLSTASGRLFAAFKPRAEVQAALKLEPGPTPRIDRAIEANLERIRAERFCSLVDGSVPGITALAAPVFDGFGEIVLSLTLIGPNATLAPERDAPAGQALRRAADELSARLGSRPPVSS